MEVGVSESPALQERLGFCCESASSKAYMLAELVVVCIFDFMKVVLVQLPHKAGKIGVFEHSRKNRFREFIHILQRVRSRMENIGMEAYFDDKAISLRAPADH